MSNNDTTLKKKCRRDGVCSSSSRILLISVTIDLVRFLLRVQVTILLQLIQMLMYLAIRSINLNVGSVVYQSLVSVILVVAVIQQQ